MSQPFSTVEVSALRKVFGRHPALAGVAARFAAGELTLLLGPNGAGKSTLLAILATLSRPTSGEVRYGRYGHADAAASLRGAIGLVGHAPMLYGDLTVRENLIFFARMQRLVAPAAAADRWIARLHLASHAGRPAGQLSRGLAQRAALARALLAEPHLVLLDEPFTGLDAAAEASLRARLAELRGAGRIVVVVTHQIAPLDGLCDQVLVLRAGRVAARLAGRGLAAGEVSARYAAALAGRGDA